MFFPHLAFGGLVTAIIKYIFDDQALTTGAFSNDNEEFVQDIENFELWRPLQQDGKLSAINVNNKINACIYNNNFSVIIA